MPDDRVARIIDEFPPLTEQQKVILLRVFGGSIGAKQPRVETLKPADPAE